MKVHGKKQAIGRGMLEKCLRHNIVLKFKQECPECKKEEKLRVKE